MMVRSQGRSEPWASLTGRQGEIDPLDRRDRQAANVPSLVVDAPAKLNLSLRVLGRRQDGYHELETLMVSVGLYDSLYFTATETAEVHLQCRMSGPALSRTRSAGILTNGPDNLVVRAAELLQQRTGYRRGARISLIKRIPLQAGLGGGSSDAAATLVALNRIWNLELSSDDLHQLAAELGSDVNFFIDSPGAALCRGRGERVYPARLSRRLHAVIASPLTGLSTAEVFREWSSASASDVPPGPPAFAMQARVGAIGCSEPVPMSGNDLEGPACRLNDDVEATLAALRRVSHGPTAMSGSGSACFTLCQTAHHARRIAARLRAIVRGTVIAVDSCA